MGFLLQVLRWADCDLLLDLNNLEVNRKNHGGPSLASSLAQVPWGTGALPARGRPRVQRPAGHASTRTASRWMPRRANGRHGCSARMANPMLLEWDNDVPDLARINQELAWLGFTDYVRGLSDELPPGHSRQGMEVCRHLVRLGVEQQVQARHPGLRDQLTEAMGEPAWEALITGSSRSAWTSPFLWRPVRRIRRIHCPPGGRRRHA